MEATEKRVGRPPKPEGEKRQQIGVRTSPELKGRLEAASAANGRSVAQEAEFRLQEAFDLAELLGGDRTKALLIQVAAQVARAEAATGKLWHEDIATHEAASLLVAATLRRVRPTPPNFKEGVELQRRINDVWARMSALQAFLTKCNVIAEGRNALAIAVDNRSTGIFRDLPQEQWRNPEHDDKPISDEEAKLLSDTLGEYRGLAVELQHLSAQADEIRRPLNEARAEGKAIFDLIDR